MRPLNHQAVVVSEDQQLGAAVVGPLLEQVAVGHAGFWSSLIASAGRASTMDMVSRLTVTMPASRSMM